MLEALKFVQGAIAKKDFVPALTHFCIKDGLVKGFNGKLALSTPIDIDLSVTPKAIPFVKAIQACKSETISIGLTKAGKLRIQSGKFKAFIECTTETYPDFQPEGVEVQSPSNFLSVLKNLKPFISDDASRPWSNGILFNGQMACVTNNIILVQCWTEFSIPYVINLPINAVNELIRIGKEPSSMQVSATTITFWFGDDTWLRSSLLNAKWPSFNKVLDNDSNQVKSDPELFEVVEHLSPFLDKSKAIYSIETGISTHLDLEEGACIDYKGLPINSSFNAEMLLLLKDKALTYDFSSYPKPCLFFGENIRGAIVGRRL